MILHLPWRHVRLPMFLQMEACECGLASLAMVAAYLGVGRTLVELRRELPVSRKGMTVRGLVRMADALSLSTRPVKLDMDELPHLQLPCILHWDMDHFVVLRSLGRRGAVIHDPAVGVRRVSMKEFARRFTGVAVECDRAVGFEPLTRGTPPALRQWGLQGLGLRRALLRGLVPAAMLEVLAVLMPFFLQWVVDEALPARQIALLDGLVVGFGLLALIGASLDAVRGWTTAVLSMELNMRWTSSVLAHALRLPLAYFERRHAGDILSCFGSITTVQRTLTNSFIESIIDGALSIGTLALMAWYNTAGAMLAVGSVAFYSMLRAWLQRPLREATTEQIVQAARQQSHFLESLRGIQGIRLFGRADQRQQTWSSLVARQSAAELRLAGIHISHEAAHRLLFGLQRLLVIWLAARDVLDGSTTLGLLLAFLAYLDQFNQRTGALVDRVLDLALLRLHLDRVGDIVHTQIEAPDPQLPVPSATASPAGLAIQIRGLSYSHSFAEEPLFRGLDLDIAPGECVALVGPSGCGKTTLIKLILGLLDPLQGEVRIDGVPLEEYGRNRYRQQVGTVMQDDVLFNGSLADNICFFDPEPDLDHIIQCARLAAVHDDIQSMPMSYNTLIGEGGVGLSGGQKQRVMLARALYGRPRLLVLDEATSHLDVPNERNVNEAIRRLTLTRIVIAHRPETIAMASRVVTLNGGRIEGGLQDTLAVD